MSFNTSLSGLNAASKDLAVTSNNIANANSTGFKKSRGEFGDIYAVSALGNSKTAVGQGVATQYVRQQFTQGQLDFTENSLDLAVSGQGFFAFQPSLTSTEAIYSRAGALGVNKEGFVVNNASQYLKVLPVNSQTGAVTSTSLATARPLQLPAGAGQPTPTSNVNLAYNLPATATEPLVTPFDSTTEVPAGSGNFVPNTQSYNQATSVQVYDSLGNAHIVTTYFVKTANPNDWEVWYQFDNKQPTQGTNVTFNSDGTITGPVQDTITITAADLANGAADLTFNINHGANSTQYNAAFQLYDLNQDGQAPGRLSGLSIGEDGLVRATYTNGSAVYLGKIPLVDFNNVNGLKQVGNNSWIETLDSGAPLVGEPGSGKFGLIQSGALEASNVDLTQELVHLITAQRNFQANAKAIETNKAISDTIINIR
ncbi:MAG: flagellar hook protein FlgE [Halothiobacillaceae bacterium]|jgi:flagellar hook protein FlgE|nr:flagellar hook protein FlgE [Halothiobacillaceae bacterium]